MDPADDTELGAHGSASALAGDDSAFGLAPGQVVGRYIILDRRGQGGGGSVYAAHDTKLDRKVAIKILHAAGQADQAELVLEAQTMAKLSHPNVVAVFDVGVLERRRVFLSMDLIEGSSARRWALAAPRSWREVLAVYRQAGAGLAAAHVAGIVHCDFKPDNVLVAPDGRALVTDFGIATTAVDRGEPSRPAERTRPPRTTTPESPTGDLGEVATEHHRTPPSPIARLASPARAASPVAIDATTRRDATRRPRGPTRSGPAPGPTAVPTPSVAASSGASIDEDVDDPDYLPPDVAGTIPYLAPERFRAEPASVLADQFAFAVSLYEALYGERPYDHKVRRSDPERWRLRDAPAGSKVPSWLRRAVARGLALDPAARYPGMRGFLEVLDPAPSTRRYLALAVVAAAAAATTGVLIARPASAAPCPASGADWSGRWDRTTRERMRNAFAATRYPNQASTFEGVARALDRYTAAWSVQSLEACRDTRISGIQSDEVLTLRATCLARSRGQAGALIGALERADGAAVGQALVAVYALPDLATCGDLVALRSPVTMPSDPLARATIESVRTAMQEAWAQYVSGQRDAGAAAAHAAVEAAGATRYAPLEAEAHLLAGRITSTSLGQSAEQLLQRAIFLGEEARDLETQFGAASELTYFYSNKKDLAQARLVAGFADAYFGALHRPQRLEASMLRLRALVAEIEGDAAAQVALARQAIEADRRSGAPNPVFTARLYNGLGVSASSASEFGEAIASMARAIELREQLFGKDAPEVAMSLINQALNYWDVERCEEALPLVQRGARIAAIYGEHERELGWWAEAALAQIEVCLGRARPALDRLAVLVEQARRVDDPAVEEAHVIGARAHIILGEARTAVEQTTAALARTEARVGTANAYRMDFLIGAAEAQLAAGNPKAASGHLEAAIALSRAVRVREPEIARAQVELARALIALRAPRAQIDAALDAAQALASKHDLRRLPAAIQALRALSAPSPRRGR